MKKAAFVLLPLLFALGVIGFTSAATVIKGPYACGLALNLSCVARDVVVLNASPDLSTWMILYNQYAVNGTNAENRTEIYFENSTGFKKRLATDYGANSTCSGGACSLVSITETNKYLDGFYDAGSNKVFVIYAQAVSGQPNTVNYAAHFSYDLAAGTTSSLATYSSSPLTFLFRMDGVAIRQLNSTHYYVVRDMYRSGGSGDIGLFLTRWNIASGTAEITLNLGAAFDNMTTSMYSNGTHLLLGFGNKSGILWKYAFNNSNLASYTINQIYSSTGTNYGPYIFNNRSALFYSTKDGNQEIYFMLLNGSLVTRLSSTSIGEYLGNVINVSDGTYVFSEWNATANSASLETFCLPTSNPVPTFGTTCAGGAGGGLCLPCYAQNGTGCNPIPKCIVTYPSLTQIISDHACAGSLAFAPGVDNCGLGISFTIQDWLGVTYQSNGLYLTPANWLNESSFSTLNNGSASCTACLVSDPGSCRNLAFKSASAPAAFSGNPVYSAEVRATSPNWAGQWVNVSCVSTSIANSRISNLFFIANTLSNFSTQPSFFMGPSRGPYNDRLNFNETYLELMTTLATSPGCYNGGGTTGACWTEIPTIAGFYGIGGTDYFTYNDATQTCTTGYRSTYLLSYFTPRLLPGNYPGVVRCEGKESDNLPSISIQKNLLVEDRCTSIGYQNAAQSIAVKNVGGNLTTEFKTNEEIYVSTLFTVPGLTGSTAWDNGECQLTIYNLTNGANTAMAASYSMAHVQGGPYYAALTQDKTRNPDAVNYLSYSLPTGNYSANITCFNLGAQYCVIPTNASTVFRVNQSDGCEGTPNACTLDSCTACGNQVVTCENGRQFPTQLKCVSRTCQEWNAAELTQCADQSLYSIKAEATPSEVVCGSDDITIKTTLYKNNVPVPPLAEGLGLSCSIAIYPSDALNPGSQQGKVEYVMPVTTGPYLSFSLKGGIDAFKLANCGTRHEAAVTCYASNFTSGPKESVAAFFIGSMGSNCQYQTSSGSTVLVRDAECVDSVTLNALDKPRSCAAGSIVNNSKLCGCPAGLTYNSSENSCDGSTIVSGGWAFLTGGWTKWVTLSLLLLFLVLAPVLNGWYRSHQIGKAASTQPQSRWGQ